MIKRNNELMQVVVRELPKHQIFCGFSQPLVLFVSPSFKLRMLILYMFYERSVTRTDIYS